MPDAFASRRSCRRLRSFDLDLDLEKQNQKIAAFGSSYREASGRKAAGGGNRLPLFWHCHIATARKAPVYGLFLIGTTLALSMLRKIRSPEGFPT
ncbi:hypothetical protein ACYZTX_23330 [Pseudomonas sp. MDT1-17]